MWGWLFSWNTVLCICPVLIGVGVGVLSMNPPSFTIAHVSFSFAAAILLARIGWWLSFEQSASKYQLTIFAFIIFGIIGSLWLCSIRWVSDREHSWNKQMAQKQSSSKIVPNQASPSLHELFKTDFNTLLRQSIEMKANLSNGKTITLYATEYFDFQGKSKFIGFYIPASGPISNSSYIACGLISEEYKKTMDNIESSTIITGGFVGDSQQTSSKDLSFSGRIYIYHDDVLSLQQLATLEKIYQSKGLSVVFRGNEYLIARWNNK
jgi:hypothetical protein